MAAIMVLGLSGLTFVAVMYAAHIKKEQESDDGEV